MSATAASADHAATSAGVVLARDVVERAVIGSGGTELGVSLRNRPFAGGPVQRKGCPAGPVLVADVDQERVVVVFGSNTMSGVALLAQQPGLVTGRGHRRDKGRPPSTVGLRPLHWAAASVCHGFIVTNAAWPMPSRRRHLA